MEQKISIHHSSVMEEVSKTTAYIGSHKADGTAPAAYERIATTDYNEELLDRFYNEAINVLRHSLRLYAVSDNTALPSSGKDFTITLRMPPNWDKDKVDMDCEAYLYVTHYVLSRWSEIVDKDNAESLAGEASAHLQVITSAINKRRRPTRY